MYEETDFCCFDGEIKEFKTENVSNIIQRGGTILKTSRCDEFKTEEGRAKAYETLQKEGINALVVCGTTGEASTLTDDEHKDAIKFVVEKTAGRVPVIAGTGSNDAAYAVELTNK